MHIKIRCVQLNKYCHVHFKKFFFLQAPYSENQTINTQYINTINRN